MEGKKEISGQEIRKISIHFPIAITDGREWNEAKR